MCGIFGRIGSAPRAGLRDAALTLRHRGPDGFGEWSSPDGAVYLGHCRLAVIDLSAAGRQPMENEDGAIQVIFNGEIYNFQELRRELIAVGHTFRSRTDTEVLVHGYEQWGADLVRRLRGIFAFGIWDARKRTLLLARDRLGVKPLFFAQCGDELIFASEPRAILSADPRYRQLHAPAVFQYLQLSYTSGAASIWDGISRLPPGTCLEFRLGDHSPSVHRYWNLDERREQISFDEAIEEADALIGEAVREQLVSDVPLGVFLSGGLDSSLVCSNAVEAEPRINSFCVDFCEWQGSEAADSQRVANHLNTLHRVESLDAASCPLVDEETRDAFFAVWDEPMANSTIVPAWCLSRFVRRHVTVALSGDGGDELFCGYEWYRQSKPTPRRRAAWFLESMRRKFSMGREWPNASANRFEFFEMLHWPTFSRSEAERLFPQWSSEFSQLHPFAELRSGASLSSSRRPWQGVDVDTFLIDDNLARTDRASMAFGLEVRVPLLDHRLAELAFAITNDDRELNGPTKPLLRAIAQRRLPPTTCQKKKQGFSFPMQSLVSHEQLHAELVNGTLIQHGVMSRLAFTKLFCQRSASDLPRLWLLYVLEHWARQWLLGAPTGAPTHHAPHSVPPNGASHVDFTNSRVLT